MKSEKILCPHPNKSDENKPFWKEVGNMLVDDDLYAKLVEREVKLTIFMNDNPNAVFKVFFRKPKESASEPF